VADPWQPASYQIDLPKWAQVSPRLVQGYEQAEQMRAARGILTGKQPESWVQRAAMGDPANWMTGAVPQSQGWQGIFGIAESTPGSTRTKDQAFKNRPVEPVVGLSDDADVRASEARRMLQQATPFWEREENKALKIAAGPVSEGGGPRATEVGYAQRADIQAWMDAQRAKGPAGAAMVERFMNQQRERGLLEQPTPAVDRLIATPEQREAAMTGYDGRQPQQLQAQGGGSIRGGEMLPNQAFVDPTFGIEALRGMPVDATASSMPGVGQRGQASVGYDGEVIRDAFNQATPQPNMTFTGNGMESDTQMMVSREQDVPGITGPVLSPTATRQMNLQGADALANKYKLLAMQR